VLRDLQRALARALASNEPVETLKNEAARLSGPDRAAIESMDPEQFLLSSLLVRKLRFERICRGDTEVEAWFARDPEGFMKAFRAYNAEVLPVEFFPRPEALAFRAWCRGQGIENPAH
jgi:hypothetical protein